MIYTTNYDSPIGKILLACKEEKLIGAWIEGQKHFLLGIQEEVVKKEQERCLIQTKQWLDCYFGHGRPNINQLSLAPQGSEFRKKVWKILCKIPYGKVTTYQEIANQIAKKMKINRMSAQAIGAAVSHNPISIIIPCHRVIGTNGSLTGYAGGLDKKLYLLQHENVDMEHLFLQKNKRN